ncbi:pancreatic lipase-related protein 2 isoform X1 [Bicyclus anynana]|uniref:Pancreatic lipase-related protein 2 isoform X1 n=1 Tax=Bicyclus anynana TaxID=110368 RepID=A0A6J1NT58_BICAN|nr:pancreatic lipase-related protein 2 isoform X1 [Bicyclus anynana]
MLNNTATACRLMSFFIGITQVCFMPSPVGDCDMCCQRDDTIDIQYKLFTRNNPIYHDVIIPGDAAALSQTRFSPSRPTVIYLFGFSEAITGASTTMLRNAFLENDDYNFIAVDWSRLVVFPWYISAVKNTRYMGERLADFVEFLNSTGVPAGTLHVVGFSLGAEAAGFAGKTLKTRGLMLGRITGLDPAYPGYSLGGKDNHLSKGDAIFIDVVHTNPGLFGFPQPIGDVDFFPNYGQWIQPGCWFDQLLKNSEFNYVYGCSHNRSWRLFAESVRNPAGFPATLCRDWRSATASCRFMVHGYMGFGAQPPAKGQMFLLTNEKPPYARNGP